MCLKAKLKQQPQQQQQKLAHYMKVFLKISSFRYCQISLFHGLLTEHFQTNYSW